ncbi:hypothetical protein TWF481_003850 [Arthrobotrys musiformis]|uniref:Uncharacterized protein n=1 Tax=Arthrobotrys musiformis TaxID=47236 RepID=A0AAV9WJV3_9PEZI
MAATISNSRPRYFTKFRPCTDLLPLLVLLFTLTGGITSFPITSAQLSSNLASNYTSPQPPSLLLTNTSSILESTPNQSLKLNISSNVDIGNLTTKTLNITVKPLSPPQNVTSLNKPRVYFPEFFYEAPMTVQCLPISEALENMIYYAFNPMAIDSTSFGITNMEWHGLMESMKDVIEKSGEPDGDCQCYAKLGQPRVPEGLLRRPLHLYQKSINSIPRTIIDHPDNFGWEWIVDPAIAEYTAQTIGHRAETYYITENRRVNIAAPGDPPHYVEVPGNLLGTPHNLADMPPFVEPEDPMLRGAHERIWRWLGDVDGENGFGPAMPYVGSGSSPPWKREVEGSDPDQVVQVPEGQVARDNLAISGSSVEG